MYKSSIILLLFLLGFYYIYRSNDIEAFTPNQNSNGDEEYTSIVPVVIFSSASVEDTNKYNIVKNKNFNFLNIF